MDEQFWFLIGMVAVGFFVMPHFLRRPIDEPKKYKYSKIQHIVSPAERSFLGMLNAVLDDGTVVLTKVRVADVISPERTSDRRAWTKAFNAIASKHFDFVLCRATDMSVLCAIELNDKSHNSKKRQERDEFLRDACAGAGLPLLEVTAKVGYTVQYVTDLVKPYVVLTDLIQPSIACAKCGTVMERTPSGSNKNHWECTNQTCRHKLSV